MYTIKEIYEEIDGFAPFSSQDSWDNSGLLVGSMQNEVRGILITLDISRSAVQKAIETGCNLIFSHHPVIFSGLKKLDPDSIVCQLVREHLSAVCCHTPLDMADGGINDILVNMLRKELDCQEQVQPLCPDGLGRILTLKQSQSLRTVAEKAKKALSCEMVRFSADEEKQVQKIGICSGSGASLLEEIAGTCDCFLTGDIKHDRWYKAEELGISLLDCGHYCTEVVMIETVAQLLEQAFPDLPVVRFPDRNPVKYL